MSALSGVADVGEQIGFPTNSPQEDYRVSLLPDNERLTPHSLEAPDGDDTETPFAPSDTETTLRVVEGSDDSGDNVRDYLRAIGQHDLLTREEEL
ncbi:MAG: hypothetical protein O3A47_02700 [Chloroflexi bacterium]|nr:hypothetical protein [Chloroflexota bacterium]